MLIVNDVRTAIYRMYIYLYSIVSMLSMLKET